MTATHRQLQIGLCSVALTVSGWLWLLLGFTARTEFWWNSIHLFIGIFTLSLLLAVFSLRSPAGILGLVLAIPSLALAILFALPD